MNFCTDAKAGRLSEDTGCYPLTKSGEKTNKNYLTAYLLVMLLICEFALCSISFNCY